ncbi:MAG: dienelactone hydrolase family protein [Actinomycetota bacterium]|nr:dienelactone hydrolase family protein [Actinomycetota bacterium]
MVEYASEGAATRGYLAPASEGAGLGVVVIPGWWGLVDHIVDVCERFSAEGFTALDPDLHHGTTAPDREPDEAARARMALDVGWAARQLSGAVDFLQAHPAVRGQGVGLVGFGMGGGVALWLATLRPDAVRAVVPFYGFAPGGREPDWSALAAPVEGHYADHDDLAGPETVAGFEERLRDLGKDVRVFTYPGTGRAFFDETRPDAYDEDAARQAWVRTLEFLRAKMG